MPAVNPTVTIVQQLVEFAAHLRQQLQSTEKAIAFFSQDPGLASRRECSHNHQESLSNTENDAHGQPRGH